MIRYELMLLLLPKEIFHNKESIQSVNFIKTELYTKQEYEKENPFGKVMLGGIGLN